MLWETQKKILPNKVPEIRRIPPILWTKIRRELIHHFTENEADGVRVLVWAHKQVRLWRSHIMIRMLFSSPNLIEQYRYMSNFRLHFSTFFSSEMSQLPDSSAVTNAGRTSTRSCATFSWGSGVGVEKSHTSMLYYFITYQQSTLNKEVNSPFHLKFKVLRATAATARHQGEGGLCWQGFTGGAKLRAFLRYCTVENTQLSPSLTRKP